MTRRLALIAALASAALAAMPTSAQDLDLGGRFELTNVEGERFGSAELAGRPYALFFGFTHCPEVCPMALAEISYGLHVLGPDGDDLTPVFVTVDPARDTAERLRDYLGAFDGRIVGLRGTESEIAEVARAFRATYRKVPLAGGDYTVDHTAVIYLMGADGGFFDKVDYREDVDAQIAKYRALIAHHRAGEDAHSAH